jgi:hypothetical protein
MFFFLLEQVKDDFANEAAVYFSKITSTIRQPIFYIILISQ